MRAPWKRAAAIALATCSFSILPLIGGCKTDVEKADARVSADMAKATHDLNKGSPDAVNSAIQALQKTTATKGASPEAQVESNSLLAQAEVDAADRIVNGDNGVAERQIQIARLTGDMDTLASQIQVNNINIASYRALEPTGGRKAVEQATAAAQKGENGAWFPGNAPIPSLDTVKRREQDLQKQIADLTQQRDDLTTKRTQALDRAAKFSQQADSTTGKESVGYYIQAANQRKEAADDQTRIQFVEEQLVPLQQDLAVVQLQRNAVEAAVSGLNDQTQTMENGWKAIQQHIDEAANFSKSLLDGSGSSGGSSGAPADAAAASAPASTTQPARSLAALGAELDTQVSAAQELRKKAIELLNSAFAHDDAALKTATKLTNDLTKQSTAPELSKLPEKKAWQELIAINQPAGFKIRQAAIQSRLARIRADEYAELAQRNRLANLLAPALKQSGLDVPQSLTSALPPAAPSAEGDAQVKKVESDLKSDSPPFAEDAAALDQLAASQSSPAAQQATAAAQASLAYKWAISLLNEVAQNAGQGDFADLLTNTAHAALMANYYGQAQFSLLSGQQQASDADLKSAISERDAVAQANARYLLPTILPPGLEFAAATRTRTAPATQPATTAQ